MLSWQEVGFTNQDNSDVLGLWGSVFLVFLLGGLRDLCIDVLGFESRGRIGHF